MLEQVFIWLRILAGITLVASITYVVVGFILLTPRKLPRSYDLPPRGGRSRQR